MSRVIDIAIVKDSMPAGDWVPYDLPREGKYDDPPPTRRRCGVGRVFELEFQITDPVVVNIVAMEYE